MPTSARKSTRGGAVRAGSLYGDVAEIAATIYRALVHFDVTVWSNADADILLARADRSPEIEPQYLAGTYSIGARLSDIESDLRSLQRERVSSAILF